MKIAVASGKGGTGKTTVAVNLAFAASVADKPVQLLDCDVEEPNSHIFVKPRITGTERVEILVPKVTQKKCSGCGECAKICNFSAIVCIKGKVLIFPELCHACGGCALVCPEGAIEEEPRELGVVESGNCGQIGFVHGRLRVGEAISPLLIKKVKAHLKDDALNIIDAPPGTTCPVIASIRDTDFVVLVTEPTPFGLNDLKLAVELVRQMGLRHGVVINRCDIGDGRVVDFCREEGIEILLEIPEDRHIAEAYSQGRVVIEALPHYRKDFESLLSKIEEKVL